MSYIICFWDKSKVQVDEQTGEKLKNAWRAQSIKTFELGENIYALNALEKIITKDEAFNVFPSEWQQLSKLEDRPPTKETMLALEEGEKNPAGLKRLDEIKRQNGLK